MTGDAKFSRIPARAADLELTAADWRVLHVIGLYADKAGHACPSLERIAKITRIERRHVTRSTKRLAQLGLIHYERRRQGDGWANNRYQILYAPDSQRWGSPLSRPGQWSDLPLVCDHRHRKPGLARPVFRCKGGAHRAGSTIQPSQQWPPDLHRHERRGARPDY